MKKKILLFLGVFGLIIPSLVYADMGAPEIRSYEVVISNVDGAKTIGDKKVIPYETKCTVNYESEYDGFLHLDINCTGDEFTYTINAKDARILKDEYLPTSEDKLDKVAKYYVFKDLEMHRGPSFKYDKIGQTIPAGTVINVSHIDGVDRIWGYTEYEGKKGWVYIYWHDENNKIAEVLQDEKNKSIITVKGITKLYEYPNDEKTKIEVSIPINTALKTEYFYKTWTDTGLYYINYNGVSGWIDMLDGVGVYKPGSILIMNPQKIKVYDNNFNSTSLNIKRFQEFVYDYNYQKYIEEEEIVQGLFHITYNGKGYYIDTSIVDSEEASEFKKVGALVAYPCKVKVLKDATVYDSYDLKTAIGTIKAGEKFNYNYNVYISEMSSEVFFISTSSVSGWVKSDCIDKLYDEESEYKNIVNIEESPSTTSSKATTDSKKENIKDAGERKDMSTKEIVIMCVLGAVILAIVTIVIIVLINRKKKEKAVVNEKVENIEENQEITIEENK